MKKQIKKIFAVVMALTMVFAMSASAFAAESGVDVTIKMDGEVAYPTVTVTADQIAGHAGTNGHIYSTEGASAAVPKIGYTAADAMIEAWLQLNGSGVLLEDEILTGWDNSAEHPGLFFTTYAGLSSDAGDYYLVESYQENGKTMYKYYWRGYTWNLYINGSTKPADFYATEYSVSNTSSIDFDYALTKSAEFATDYYIPGCLNASEDPYN